MRLLIAFVLLILPSLASAQAPACLATPTIEPNTRLSQISDIWYGDSSFRYAVLLATNVRTDDPQFKFIGDINELPVGANVCVPPIDEALRFKTRYDRYISAVQDMAVAQPFEVVNTLDPLPISGTYTVASWIRSGSVANYPVGSVMALSSDIWVTLEPNLQEFCKAYVATVTNAPEALNLRIEQRLGMPPGSTNSHFVSFELDAASSGQAVFRPCADPATNTTSCAVGAPAACPTSAGSCEAHKDFFFEQYYNAFGTEHPIEFPWTSLGYTFDWAPTPVGFAGQAGFLRVGESEYVIPATTQVRVASVETTADYCAQ
jgi:hypothetical protein